ncbi:Protein FRPR-9 b, partial [Aphelenchoides avenae]
MATDERISDLILIICNFFFLVLPVMVVESDSFFWNNLFPVIIRYSYPLALTAQTCGVYLTVLVSVHRFLGVCTPFQAKRWVTRRPVQYAIVGSVAFSVLVNVPTWLELTLVPCYSQKFDAVSTMIALAPFHEWTYIFIKKTVVYTFVMFVIPFAILITVNWKIIMALKQSSNLRTMHTYSTKSMSDVTTDNIIKQFRLLKNTKYTELFQALTKMSHRPTTGTSPSATTAAHTKTEVGFRPSADVFKSKFTNSLRDRSVTLMLLAIVALFLLCNGLAFCNSIVESVMLVSDSGDAEELDPYKAYLISLFEVSVE